jgi:hypothetical protein
MLHGYACVSHTGDQVVMGMAITMTAAGLTVVLAIAWFSLGGQTPPLPESVRFARLFEGWADAAGAVPVIGGVLRFAALALLGHTAFVYGAFALVVGTWWLLYRTRFGLRLRAVGEKQPVGMIHFDAHTDLYDGYFGGFKYTHGTPFRRAIEEGVLDPKRTIQIGLRGSMYDLDDFEWGEKMGIRMVRIEEVMEKGPKATMAEARKIVGDGPTYVSFDIDMLDPAYAPGTGTPEVGGFTTFQAQQMLREMRGLHIVGGDVVEVSPPFDPSGVTAHAGVTMMFEILCPMAEDVAKCRGK